MSLIDHPGHGPKVGCNARTCGLDLSDCPFRWTTAALRKPLSSSPSPSEGLRKATSEPECQHEWRQLVGFKLSELPSFYCIHCTFIQVPDD